MGAENSIAYAPIERCQKCGGIIPKDRLTEHSAGHSRDIEKALLAAKAEDSPIVSKVEDILLAAHVEDILLSSHVEDILLASKVEDVFVASKVESPTKTPNVRRKSTRKTKKRKREEEAIEEADNKQLKLDHTADPTASKESRGRRKTRAFEKHEF